MQKIIPCLWFDNNAEEVVKLYTSIFKDSKTGRVSRYDEASANASGRPVGSVLTIEFQIEGQDFLALNGGPIFKFNEAISFQVYYKTQQEVDHYWENSPRVERKTRNSAVGSRINMACHGRSSRLY